MNITQIKNFFQEFQSEQSRQVLELSDVELEQKIIHQSKIKRFDERSQADPDFQRKFLEHPEQGVVRYNLNMNSEEIALCKALVLGSPEKITHLRMKKEKAVNYADFSSNIRYQAWRKRQIARISSQMRKSLSDEIPNTSVSFELSKGCSVGCWFCAVSAPRLGDIFTYNNENAKLWCEILDLLKYLLGDAAKSGFCYWASDPLDNPDYEKFCIDFYKVLGIFPSTTTALFLKDTARTRSLLKLSEDLGCMMNRFSILSLKILDQLYQEFSPEELAFVKLEFRNPESAIVLSNSGRAREYNQRQAQKKQETKLDDPLLETSACVSGFLFSMVERSVKLISPYNADERWPLGYRIYEEGNFSNIDDLKTLLEGMISRHMPLAVMPDKKIKFRPDLEYQNLSDGFKVSTKFLTQRFSGDLYIKQLGDIIYKGDKTAQEIVSLFNIYGIPSDNILDSLNLMFQNAIFDE